MKTHFIQLKELMSRDLDVLYHDEISKVLNQEKGQISVGSSVGRNHIRNVYETRYQIRKNGLDIPQKIEFDYFLNNLNSVDSAEEVLLIFLFGEERKYVLFFAPATDKMLGVFRIGVPNNAMDELASFGKDEIFDFANGNLLPS